jgi:hypothetical protein
VSHAEEIAQGDVHARRLPAVVVHAQAEQAGPGKLVVGHGEPDVAHYAGSAEVRHHVGFAGHDALAVVVAAHEAVPAGDPLGGEGLQAGEIEQIERVVIGDLGGRAARQQKDESTRSHRACIVQAVGIRGKAGSDILNVVLFPMVIFQGFKEFVAFTLAGAGMVVAQQHSGGARSIFEGSSDVGKTKVGSTVYEPAGNLYRVTGGGADMWGAADDFHFSWVRLSGDAALTAGIQFPWSSKDPLEKAVLIFRQSLDPASPYADVAIHADGHITLQYRATAGGKTADVTAAEHGSTRLRIERSGNKFTAYTGSAGGKLTAFSETTIAMEGPVYVGIGVCAHDAEGLTTVTFSNVSIERPSASPGANKK